MSSRRSLKRKASSSLALLKRRDPIPWTPKAYHKRAVRWLLEHGGAGLLLDPGLGKTSISLAAFKILKASKIVDVMLVVAPLRPAYMVWPAERQKWIDFHGLKMVILHGSQKEHLLEKGGADIYVVNVDGLDWLTHHRKFKERFKKAVLCVDESSKFRHTKTQRYRLLEHRLPLFKRRWILTGSPAPRSLLDLYGQIYIIDLGRALGIYVSEYRYNYFSKGGWGGYSWKIQNKKAEKEIYNAIKPLVLRMDAEDYLKLPPLVGMIGRKGEPLIHRVVLDDDSMLHYRQMENLFITDLKGHEVTAANAAVATMKCRQIAGGGLYHDRDMTKPHEKRRWKTIHDLKTEAVVDLLEEMEGQPTLIAYEFQHELLRLKKALGKDTPHIGGGVNPKKALEIEAQWNAGNIPYLLVNAQSVSHGLNLQETGRAVIWHTPTWNYEEYDQLVRRVWRQGQRERVFVHHIVAADTVDEAVLLSLHRKAMSQRDLLDALRAYYLRHEILSSAALPSRIPA